MRAVESIYELLEIAVDQRASDLHLSAGLPPILRIFGKITPLTGYKALMPPDIRGLLEAVVSEEQMDTLERKGEVDFSYGLRGVGRFRCSVYQQRGSLSCAIRIINSKIIGLNELGLPEIIADIARKKDGLVLVTGPTGSGKSTTLAAMIELINQEQQGVIITLEDPIEYLHQHRGCIINQREVGTDTLSFASGLRAALRADPDVILVGEMRDLETIGTAISAAETGHLVLSTLHTRGAANTIDRIIDAFPAESQQQIRIQLASVIQAVVSQQLIPRKDGSGMAAAVEVMLGTPAIRNMIRDSKTHQIPSAIETGTRFGMQTMDAAIDELVQRNVIDPAVANMYRSL
ncbi:MAG: type IV pilus twitching motility protein PilT [Candidatus Wallacebacter cryptica]|nr:type IV pilus twitching motility protein PilT [Bacillota bacterium]